MNKLKVGFSKDATVLINSYASFTKTDSKQYFNQLADVVTRSKKGKYRIDSEDEFASFAGVSLSFIRNWNDHTALIMLTSEVKNMMS